MRTRIGSRHRLAACALAAWLVVAGAYVGAVAEGSGSLLALLAIVVAALAGLLGRSWQEPLAVGLGSAALAAWVVGGAGSMAAPAIVAIGAVVSALLAAWSHARPAPAEAPAAASDRRAAPRPADGRLPPGVTDAALLDRLAIHEMTRARRYERPLTLLLVGVDGWPTLVDDRGRRGACDLLSTLATRVRRLLRDVDAIGLRGDGRLAVLLPETPLDGALVVATRIQQAAVEDVGLRTHVGAAVFPDDGVTVDALVREAEAGLDLAQRQRVNVVQRVSLV